MIDKLVRGFKLIAFAALLGAGIAATGHVILFRPVVRRQRALGPRWGAHPQSADVPVRAGGAPGPDGKPDPPVDRPRRAAPVPQPAARAAIAPPAGTRWCRWHSAGRAAALGPAGAAAPRCRPARAAEPPRAAGPASAPLGRVRPERQSGCARCPASPPAAP